jgi:cell division transport system permease protein
MITLSYLKNFIARSWHSHALMQVATLSVLVFTFTLIISTYSVITNIKQILTVWGDKVQITVFLEEGLREKQLSKLRDAINGLGSFKEVKYIDRKSASEIFAQQMGAYVPDLNDFEDAFPASFELTLASKKHLNRLEKTASSLSALNGVEDVSYGQEWVSNYQGLIRGLSGYGWGIVIVLILGTLFVVGNFTRLSISKNRSEIEILELVGASRFAIRTPFVVEGALQGAIAVTLALVLSYAIFSLESQLLSGKLAFLGMAKHFQYFSFSSVVSIFLAGVLAGSLGAFINVRQLNDGWSASKGVTGK